ncbi:hypothetical protein KAU11_01930 [Candidatus Babeliales bacterium]|nr:hypothetical protein [Candidatus Babeliales bacterium]
MNIKIVLLVAGFTSALGANPIQTTKPNLGELLKKANKIGLNLPQAQARLQIMQSQRPAKTVAPKPRIDVVEEALPTAPKSIKKTRTQRIKDILKEFGRSKK